MKRLWAALKGVKNLPPNTNSFAYGLGFYKLVWVFIIGCFLGCLLEMLYCYIQHGYFESRAGVLYGPLNPVYGFGAVVLALTLSRLAHLNSLLIFLGSAVVGSAFEYLCSWFQEHAFGTVSWEYSDSPLNLHGRTNVQFAVMWGLLGLVFLQHFLPYISNLIELIPNRVGIWLTWLFVVFMVLNLFISGAAVRRYTNRRLGYPPANAFTAFLDRHYPDERMQKVYPNMILVQQRPEAEAC